MGDMLDARENSSISSMFGSSMTMSKSRRSTAALTWKSWKPGSATSMTKG